VNPLLAFGQIIVSFALIAAILLQARGTGLSGTFGGDSAVYAAAAASSAASGSSRSSCSSCS
jgi:preprotein translocase subunit SecG